MIGVYLSFYPRKATGGGLARLGMIGVFLPPEQRSKYIMNKETMEGIGKMGKTS